MGIFNIYVYKMVMAQTYCIFVFINLFSCAHSLFGALVLSELNNYTKFLWPGYAPDEGMESNFSNEDLQNSF